MDSGQIEIIRSDSGLENGKNKTIEYPIPDET
jgi:hypothetical protein